MLLVQIHQPFSFPKHWACGQAGKFSLTEDRALAAEYSESDARKIEAALAVQFPSAVVQVK